MKIGVDVVWLPTYSPELNPIELLFNKLKIIAKQESVKGRFYLSIHDGIYECLSRITERDMIGFYEHVDYISF